MTRRHWFSRLGALVSGAIAAASLPTPAHGGFIDELHVWNRALTAEEMRAWAGSPGRECFRGVASGDPVARWSVTATNYPDIGRRSA